MKLWSPSKDAVQDTRLYSFMRFVKERTGRDFGDYDALWRWSVEDAPIFWDLVWDFCEIVGEKGDVLFDENDGRMMGAQFFSNARLNYAENVLRHRGAADALVFRDEKGEERSLSYDALYDQVSHWAQALRAAGVAEGDRVAGYMPNMPETIIAALAAISIGAVWSSASPDFGVRGVVDRFGQIEPKTLVTVDGYYYNGKNIDVLAKVKDVQPQINGLEKTIVIPFAGSDFALEDLENAQFSDDFIAPYEAGEIDFNRVSFNHPLFIMFSSGTTGVPKCIVHGHGGTLIQHLKEHQLQSDIRAGDKVFYFTTCGWMMWNWLVTGLASKATLLLYDGSPFYPDGSVLWDYTSAHGCTFFGTSAKYIEAMKAEGMRVCDSHDLSALRTIASTGSPLVHASFDYVYETIKKDVHLASISGGTDIVSCFMLGNPISPVYRGEIQGAGLGMAIDVYDDEQNPVSVGSGELVCTYAFPSMPVSFWNDEDGARYKGAYFDVFDNIWVHGDWVEKTENGGFIIHGRSDATLNPGGVRIGTAEIYRQVEKIKAVRDSVAIGQDWDGDVRVILFVIMCDGQALDEDMIKAIKTQIRQGASPRHVPAKVIAVDDIPKTISGKISEIAVRDIVMGRKIKNVEALANPESLDFYKDIPALQE